MARLPPTGLTAPRVENAELQRFCDQLALQINGLAGEISRVSGAGRGAGGTGTGTVPRPDDDPIPTLDTPPTPEGLEVRCGIGVCMVTWLNPFRFYRNHGLTRIYRAATPTPEDRSADVVAPTFDTAVEVGTAEWLLYVDEDVQSNTDYWYWVRFESTSQVLGPPSDVAMGRAAIDPAEVYAEIEEWLESSPLLEALRSDANLPTYITEEIRRISGSIALLVAGSADYNRVLIGEIRSELGTSLGPEKNRFSGATRAAAEGERDTYAEANPSWLAQYDANPAYAIELSWR